MYNRLPCNMTFVWLNRVAVSVVVVVCCVAHTDDFAGVEYSCVLGLVLCLLLGDAARCSVV